MGFLFPFAKLFRILHYQGNRHRWDPDRLGEIGREAEDRDVFIMGLGQMGELGESGGLGWAWVGIWAEEYDWPVCCYKVPTFQLKQPIPKFPPQPQPQPQSHKWAADPCGQMGQLQKIKPIEWIE